MIRLLDDRVLVEPIQAEDKTKSGIIIPTQAKERPQMGLITAVGPGSKELPMKVKEGEKALFGKHAGSPVELEGKSYLIMRQSDLLAII
jgi:chaperonin GroES